MGRFGPYRTIAAAGAFVAALAVGAAALTLPFEGIWAQQAEDCGKPTATLPVPRVPITLTAKRLIVRPFFTCEFRSVLPGGASFRVEATSANGKEKDDEFFTIAVLQGRLIWNTVGGGEHLRAVPQLVDRSTTAGRRGSLRWRFSAPRFWHS